MNTIDKQIELVRNALSNLERIKRMRDAELRFIEYGDLYKAGEAKAIQMDSALLYAEILKLLTSRHVEFAMEDHAGIINDMVS